MTIKEILNRAADRLSKEGAWVQKAVAKTKNGTQVNPKNPKACQWCSIGAISAETQDIHHIFYAELTLGKTLGSQPITVWNDSIVRTQDEVVAAFRKAAAL